MAGDYARASLCCEKALSVLPKNMSVQSDYALSLMRQESTNKVPVAAAA
jgi:hypothetical protein